MDEASTPARIEGTLGTLGIAQGKPPLGLGLGIYQIGQSLGLNQIELSIHESAASKLSCFRMADVRNSCERRHHGFNHGATAMYLKLGDLLARKAVRCGEVYNQTPIQRFLLRRRIQSTMNGFSGGRDAAANRFENESSIGA
jgi:hypothetical protein